jgi:hypothetical protein
LTLESGAVRGALLGNRLLNGGETLMLKGEGTLENEGSLEWQEGVIEATVTNSGEIKIVEPNGKRVLNGRLINLGSGTITQSADLGFGLEE